MKKKEIDTYPIEIIDKSGTVHTFTPSSSGTAIFTDIADQYEDNPYASIPETNFLVASSYLTKEDLELYVELGYLKRITVASDSELITCYVLTEIGRTALKWNREFKNKWKGRKDEKKKCIK